METQRQHSLGMGGHQFEGMDQHAAVLTKQGALLIDLLRRDLTRGVAKAVVQTGQGLPLLGDAVPEIGLRDFQTAGSPGQCVRR
jgi:hypothetical protein